MLGRVDVVEDDALSLSLQAELESPGEVVNLINRVFNGEENDESIDVAEGGLELEGVCSDGRGRGEDKRLVERVVRE